MIFEMALNCDDGTKIDLQPTTALIMVDETGEENLADPNYRIFGLGGCCTLAGDYARDIAAPWNKLKRQYLNMTGNTFHTADIRKIGSSREKRINEFFKANRFGRFASIASDKTHNYTDYELVSLVYHSFHNRITEIIKWMNFSDIVIIHEDSKRLMPKLEQIAGAINLSENINGIEKNINIQYFKASKGISLVGLEVSDLIIHTAGSAVRDRNSGKIKSFSDQPRLNSIFNSIDPKYASIFIMNEINIDGETIK